MKRNANETRERKRSDRSGSSSVSSSIRSAESAEKLIREAERDGRVVVIKGPMFFEPWRIADSTARAINSLEKKIELCTCEDHFQSVVMQLAWEFGWKVQHFRRVQVKRGQKTHYETPFLGDGAGEFDLQLWRERLIKAELKFGKNTPTTEQKARLMDYRLCGVESYIWWPRDWAAIVEALRPRQSP